MVKRPDFTSRKEIFALTRKFNTALEDVIADNRHSHILKIELEHTSAHFDQFGNITPAGKIDFWKDLDGQMKKFDRNRTDLKPKKLQTTYYGGGAQLRVISSGIQITYVNGIISRSRKFNCL